MLGSVLGKKDTEGLEHRFSHPAEHTRESSWSASPECEREKIQSGPVSCVLLTKECKGGTQSSHSLSWGWLWSPEAANAVTQEQEEVF